MSLCLPARYFISYAIKIRFTIQVQKYDFFFGNKNIFKFYAQIQYLCNLKYSFKMLDCTIAMDTPKHDFKSIKEAKDWAKNNIVGIYTNADTGNDIRISNLAIDKYLSKKAVEQSTTIDAHLSVLKQMPPLIKTALLKERTADKENNIDVTEIQRLYGAIRYEKQIFSVKITVKVYKNEISKAYTYEVID